MKIGALFLVNAIIAGVFGIAFVVAPSQTLAMYGVAVPAGAIVVARLFGAALVGFGALSWYAREVPESAGLRAIVYSLFVADALGFFIALHGMLSGLVGPLGWSTVALYAGLAGAYGFFAFKKPAAAAAPAGN